MKKNPKNNLKKQEKAAAENHEKLMLMFKNNKINEKPLNKKEVREVVRVIFEKEDKLHNENLAIYTGYTGVDLTEEPYRCNFLIKI